MIICNLHATLQPRTVLPIHSPSMVKMFHVINWPCANAILQRNRTSICLILCPLKQKDIILQIGQTYRHLRLNLDFKTSVCKYNVNNALWKSL